MKECKSCAFAFFPRSHALRGSEGIIWLNGFRISRRGRQAKNAAVVVCPLRPPREPYPASKPQVLRQKPLMISQIIHCVQPLQKKGHLLFQERKCRIHFSGNYLFSFPIQFKTVRISETMSESSKIIQIVVQLIRYQAGPVLKQDHRKYQLLAVLCFAS